jgi:hypothetical protein
MDFKKSLAVTTALSAVALLAANAAVAAEKPKLKIYGYQETYFGVADVNSGTTADGTPTYVGAIQDGGFNILQYGEIRFKASGMTDQGMKWGVYFESAMDDASGSGKKAKGGADEANLWLQGSWGKMEIGGQDGATDKMQVSANDLDLLGSNILGAYVDNRGDSLRGTDQTNVTDSSDDTKLTYYTPRISGFQAGVSYIPTMGSKGSVASGSSSGGMESAIAYAGKAGSTKFKVAAVYSSVGKSSASKTIDGYGVGAHVGFGAITLAAGYSHNNNWRNSASSQHAWDLGANYNGGKWEVSLVHWEGSLKRDSGGAKDKYKQTTLQGAYNLGGGLTAGVGLYLFDLNARTTANNNDGSAVIGKIRAKF